MEYVKSDILSLKGAAASLQGGRSENQDDYGFIDTPLGFLLVVCDGMGGGPGGKTASGIVKEVMMEALCGCSQQAPRAEAVKMAAERAQEALEAKMRESRELDGMGSTFIALLVNRQSALIAHAGDSRCYVLRDGKLLFRTRDHSLVEELVKRKTLTEEQARISPQSYIINRVLGTGNNHTPDIVEMPYRRGDRFVLCSDGVWGTMPQQELLERLSAEDDEKLLVGRLTKLIDERGNTNGGNHDNLTLAMVRMGCNSALKDRSAALRWTIGILIVLLIGAAGAYAYFNFFSLEARQKAFISSEVNNESAVKPLPADPDAYAPRNADSLSEVKVRAGVNPSGEEAATSETSLYEAGDPGAVARDVISCLEQWAESTSKSKSEALKASEEYLNKVKSSLKGLGILVTNGHKDDIKGISEFIDERSKDMLLIGWYADKGVYHPTAKAQGLIGEVKEKLEGIENEL